MKKSSLKSFLSVLLLSGSLLATTAFAQTAPELPASVPEAPAMTPSLPAAAPTGVAATGIPDINVVPSGSLSIPELQKAVVAGAIARDWIPTVKAENCVRCDLTVRNKHRVVVDVIITPSLLTFRYVASENMDYNPTKKKKIHRKYEGWVKILGQEINKEVVKVITQKSLQQ